MLPKPSRVDLTAPEQRDRQKGWVWQRWLMLLGFGIVLTCRKPDALFHAQFWAEDGSVFFRDNYSQGLWSLFIPYSGYYHVVPRLVAYFAGGFPLAVQPTVYALGALGATLAVVAKLGSARVRLPYKPALALALVLIPRGNGEILLTLTGLQWFLATGLILILIQDEARSSLQAWSDVAWLIIAGSSGPFSLICAPLFWLRWRYVSRSSWSFVCACLVGVCATIQLQAVLCFQTGIIQWPTAGQWLEVFVRRLVGSLLLSARYGERALATVPAALLGVGLLVVLGKLVWQDRVHRWAATVLLGAGALTLGATSFRFLHAADVLFTGFDSGDRYFFLPKLFLVWSLLICFSGESSPWWRSVVVGVLLLIGVSAIVDFRCAPYEEMHWEQQVKQFEQGGTKVITINPHWKIDFTQATAAISGQAVAPLLNSYDPSENNDILLGKPVAIRSVFPPLRVTIQEQAFLQVHPVGEIVFDVPAGCAEISAAFAIRPEAFQPPLKTAGAEFRVDYLSLDGAASTTLWRRVLEPSVAPRDGGVQTMRVALPPGATGQIVLRTLPASKANDTTNAWACWARIRFEGDARNGQ